MAIKTDLLRSRLQKSTHNGQPSLYRPLRQGSTLLNTDEATNIETVNKVGTNRKQRPQKTVNKLDTNCKQTVNKAETEIANRKQTVSTTVNTLTTNRKQTVNKVETEFGFYHLIGLQRSIILFIYENCKTNMSHFTEVMTLEYIATHINSSVKTTKTTIQRLVKKGCLQRVESKNGRGGWSKYLLPETLFKEVLHSETVNKVETNRKQNVITTVSTTVNNSLSSSSSLNNNKTTTNLSNEWNFDISPYHRFGFTTSHIKQLASLGVISAAQVEQSLIEFTFDLENNALPTIKTGKVNFLMGLFRSGNMYVSEGFKNEQEAMISEMARRSEDKRKKLLENKFWAWEETLSDEERKRILIKLPTSLMVLEKTYGISNQEVKNWYFDYFMQNIKG